ACTEPDLAVDRGDLEADALTVLLLQLRHFPRQLVDQTTIGQPIHGLAGGLLGGHEALEQLARLPGVDALGQAARLRPPRLCFRGAIELGSDPTLAGVTLGHRSYATLGRVRVLLCAPPHRLVLASLGLGDDALER